jgi:Mg-chelatase subunit ChlD
VVSANSPARLERGTFLNRADTRPISLSESIPREDGRLGETLSPTTHAFRVALLGSLALHALAAISLWYAFGSGTWAKNSEKILDTLVRAPSMDLDVCLQLDDPPSEGSGDTGRRRNGELEAAKQRAGESETIQKLNGEMAKRRDDDPELPKRRSEETATSLFVDSPIRPFSVSQSADSPSRPFAGLQIAGSPDRRFPISFFRVGVQARTVVYVIDRSASMGLRDTLGMAKRELLASLNRLPADTRFQIIIYNRAAECFRFGGRSDLVPASLENKQQAARLLESVRPEGSTDPLPALRQAVALRPEAIFFLTDADDLNIRQVNLLTQLNAGRTAIHAIELSTNHPDRGEQPLQLLARTNHGEYHAVSVGDQ